MPNDWFPALTSTSLLAIALWLSKNWLLERLKNSVKHEYEKDIETLRAELRKSEELFKSELKAKESQIEALRSGALTGISNRQSALFQRQLQAIQELWEAVISLGPAKTISTMMATINFEVAIKDTARDLKLREVFTIMGSGFDLKKIDTQNASIARPFLSPLLWAYYSAYSSIIFHAVIRMQALQSGLEKDFSDVERVTKLVKAALPEYESYIEEHGPNAYHYLLEVLEQKMLSEIERMLKGEQSDKESIQKAAEIMKEAERLMESSNAADQT